MFTFPDLIHTQLNGKQQGGKFGRKVDLALCLPHCHFSAPTFTLKLSFLKQK